MNMVKQNEFRGATLAEAVSKATAAYREAETQNSNSYCRSLLVRFDRKKQDSDRIHDRIVDIQREVDNLKSTARQARLAAVLAGARGCERSARFGDSRAPPAKGIDARKIAKARVARFGLYYSTGDRRRSGGDGGCIRNEGSEATRKGAFIASGSATAEWR